MLIGLCTTTAIIYWPGFSGAYLLDDYSSILLASRYYPDLWLVSISKLIQGEFPGRPIAMLSFGLNLHEWPTSAWGFKYTNFGLHLTTGLVGLLFFMKLLAKSPCGYYKNQHITLAMMAAGLWLVHPLNISTTLYIVQRMTILSTLFSLLALIVFIIARDLLQSKPLFGWFYLIVIYPLLVVIGFLCKENAFLTLPLTLLVDYFISQNNRLPAPKHYNLWKLIYLVSPILIFIFYFSIHFEGVINSYRSREFSLTQRLLTEPRILIDYIFRILIPNGSDISVFHDDITTSTSLLKPITTLASILLLIFTFILSFLLRNRFPIIFFSTTWFLISHTLESSIFPLELYFEHRNYTASFGLILLFSVLILHAGSAISRYGASILFGAIFILTSFAAWNASNIWGNIDVFAEMSYSNHPDSERAVEFYANHLRATSRIDDAHEVLSKYLSKHPFNAGVLLLQLQFMCLSDASNQLDSSRLDAIIKSLRRSTHNYGAVQMSHNISMMINDNKCPSISSSQLDNILDILISNPAYKDNPLSMHNLYIAKANVYVKQRNLDATIKAIENAVKYKKVITSYILAANILVSANRNDLAKKFIREAKHLDESNSWPKRNAHQDMISLLLSKLNSIDSTH